VTCFINNIGLGIQFAAVPAHDLLPAVPRVAKKSRRLVLESKSIVQIDDVPTMVCRKKLSRDRKWHASP
jgi:hypothetical protein